MGRREYNPRATDEEYAEGYAFGWEMASDPLHEDGYDPQLDPAIDTAIADARRRVSVPACRRVDLWRAEA